MRLVPINIKPDVDAVFTDKISDLHISAIPRELSAYLAERGWSVNLHRHSTNNPDVLHGDVAIAMPDDRTRGKCAYGRDLPKQILCFQHQASDIGAYRVVNGLISPNEYLEEFVHAFDREGGYLAHTPPFRAAHAAAIDAMPDNERDGYSYYMRGPKPPANEMPEQAERREHAARTECYALIGWTLLRDPHNKLVTDTFKEMALIVRHDLMERTGIDIPLPNISKRPPPRVGLPIAVPT